MKHRQGLFNIYLTTAISVALVLCLIGLECMVILSARELIRRVKENVVLTVVLSDACQDCDVTEVDCILEQAPWVLDSRFISKDEALKEHIENLGEDPVKFLGFNPLADAYELHLTEAYAQTDSIEEIKSQLMSVACVEKIVYQEDIVKVLDSNISEFSLILLVIAAALLVIAVVLIANTIQLQVSNKRFLINTMRLVGATSWVIKWPFIKRNLLLGVESGIVAILVLIGTYYYVQSRLGVALFALTWQNVCVVIGVVLCSGLLITFLSSWVATNIYIRMKIDRMYEI